MDQYGFSAVDRPRSDRLRRFPVLRSRVVAIQGLRRISANGVENILTEGDGFRQKLCPDMSVNFRPGTWSTSHRVLRIVGEYRTWFKRGDDRSSGNPITGYGVHCEYL